MGFLGSELGGEIGSVTRKYIGKQFFKNKGTGERVGRLIGKIGGNYLPSKKEG